MVRFTLKIMVLSLGQKKQVIDKIFCHLLSRNGFFFKGHGLANHGDEVEKFSLTSIVIVYPGKIRY